MSQDWNRRDFFGVSSLVMAATALERFLDSMFENPAQTMELAHAKIVSEIKEIFNFKDHDALAMDAFALKHLQFARANSELSDIDLLVEHFAMTFFTSANLEEIFSEKRLPLNFQNTDLIS